MAFLKNIFRGKVPKEALDRAGDVPKPPPTQDLPVSVPGLGSENEKDLSGYRVNTIKIQEESSADSPTPSALVGGGETDGVPKPMLDDLGIRLEEDVTGKAPDGSEENSVAGPPAVALQDDLLDIFGEEAVVDEKLEALSSRVEDVAAEELAEELRMLVQDLEPR